MNNFKKEERAKYVKEIKRIYEKMSDLSPDSKEYGYCADRLKTMLSTRYDGKSKDNSINPNTIITCLTNLGGVLLIITAENWMPLTSKALSFLIKPKV